MESVYIFKSFFSHNTMKSKEYFTAQRPKIEMFFLEKSEPFYNV